MSTFELLKFSSASDAAMEFEEFKVESEKEEKTVIVESFQEQENIENAPRNYDEIYKSYKVKDYNNCLALLSEVEEEHTEYQILKSACYIHLGDRVSEAHEILDAVLAKCPDNEFTIYAKGLAYYHEEEWEKSIEYFSKARELNPSADMDRAEILLEKAREKLQEQEELLTPTSTKSPSMLFRRTSSLPYIYRRFGCEICNHFFGKKFNLDRHNRSIHNRRTPDDFPTKPVASMAATKEIASPSFTEDLPEEMEEEEEAFEEPKEPVVAPVVRPVFKKGKVKCHVCRKMFKRSSIARHSIIHTGRKQHQCKQCAMAFFQKSDLTRHEVSSLDVFWGSWIN